MWRKIILKRNGKDQKRSKRWILAWTEMSELRHGTSVLCDNALSSKSDNQEERTLERTRWRKESWMLYIEARILVRIYLIIVYFRAIFKNKATFSNQIKWVFKFPFCVNLASQMSHLNCFFSLCILVICFFKVYLCAT